MYCFLPSLTFGLYIYVGVSDCLVLACAKVLGTLQPCQLLWPPKAFLLTKEASNLVLTSQWTQVSPLCHYFQWGILGGEPLATRSVLNIHSVYSHKCPALLTPGFAKSPQCSFFFHPKTLCIFFLKMCFRGRLSPQRMTGPGISMLTQPFSF